MVCAQALTSVVERRKALGVIVEICCLRPNDPIWVHIVDVVFEQPGLAWWLREQHLPGGGFRAEAFEFEVGPKPFILSEWTCVKRRADEWVGAHSRSVVAVCTWQWLEEKRLLDTD